jgi:hypothetical protein
MIKEELINALQQLPDGMEVKVVNYKQNYLSAFYDEEPEGVYIDFEIVVFDEELNDDPDVEPFAAIVFDDPDIVIEDDEMELRKN